MKSLPQPLSLSHLGLINLLKNTLKFVLCAKHGIKKSMWLQVSLFFWKSSKTNSGDKLNPPPDTTKTMVDPGDKFYLAGYWF